MQTAVYNLKGEIVGQTELADRIFSYKWNSDLVHQALIAQAANRRKPWAHAKGRGEVSGGGKKPWRQKHTGRSRQGSIRSPIWKGGGVSHGPSKERDFSKKINKKMLRRALYSVLSKRLKLGELRIVDSLEMPSFKTKELLKIFKVFFKNPSLKVLNTLLVSDLNNKNLNLASRNIPKSKSAPASSLNVEDVLKYKNILIEKKAVPLIK